MTIRALPLGLIAAFCLSSCGETESGPIVVSAIGETPVIVNPNLKTFDAATALALDSTAQGLVRFDASGQIEPALAQSWIVSDDGLRYTFRLARAEWEDGDPVTAEQVAARLRAAGSRASRNPLKDLLGTIDEVVAMTDDVLEISLAAPRANFLQLLAQPEMAILRSGEGTGPYRVKERDGAMRLATPRPDDETEEEAALPPILLRGESAAKAVARFELGGADYVTGGTIGDLPLARASYVKADALLFDPAEGLFGLAFVRTEGFWEEPAARAALSLALDRGGLATALQIPELRVRNTLLPDGLEDMAQNAAPSWAGLGLEDRRRLARQALAPRGDEAPRRISVAVPDSPGYRLLFALLRRDWRAVGVDAVAVGPDAPADLAFVDAVAPTAASPWYLRRFTCDAARVCDPEIDDLLADARQSKARAERVALLAQANERLRDAVFFIPIGSPVRWSLVSPRLTGFRPNPFARHPLGELIAQ